VFGSEAAYDRAPVVRRSSTKPDAPAVLASVASALDMTDLESTGFLSMQQCLIYLVGRVRDTLEVRWEPEEFVEFAQFHIRAMCSQSHIEQDIFTFEDLERMVVSLRAVDNSEFIGTRLFRQHDEASVALRHSMRLVWAKKGEIVQSQGERLNELTVLYHGTASGIRQTESNRLQRVVQLGSGQVFGFIEMILGVPSMLTLSMESEGTVLMLPIDHFISVMKADETLLWNVMYETLTEISRIALFIQATPFPKEAASEPLPALEPEAPVSSGVAAAVLGQKQQQVVPGAALNVNMEPAEIIERVFGVKLVGPDDLREFRIITLAPNSPLYDKGSRAVALWVMLEGELDLPEALHARVNGARIVGEMGLLTRQDRSRHVRTVSRCVLLRVSLSGLHLLVSKDIEVMWKLARPALANVVTLLSQIHVGFEHRLIKSGKQLYRAGEPSESLYILINGRLRIADAGNNFRHDVSKPGESVAEMSLLSGTTHQHNCYAVRDTELLVLNRDAFNAVLEEDPQEYVRNLFKTLQERSTSAGSKYGNKPNRIKTVAIMRLERTTFSYSFLSFSAVQMLTFMWTRLRSDCMAPFTRRAAACGSSRARWWDRAFRR
jgi:CRP-like cAMP-binding protein